MIEKATNVQVGGFVPVQATIERQEEEQENHAQGHGYGACPRSLPNAGSY
ncbi:MAG: hypothetical protein ACREJ5_01555 [Geminicoccaceae bacterium]